MEHRLSAASSHLGKHNFFLPELKVSHEEWRSLYILHLHNASENVAGRKTWKSTTNLTENTSFNESNKKGSTKCSTFYCVPEGYHPDIEDDNEKAHIKECLYMKGKVSPIIRIVSMILSFTNRGLVKLLRVWWFWICWFSSCFFSLLSFPWIRHVEWKLGDTPATEPSGEPFLSGSEISGRSLVISRDADAQEEIQDWSFTKGYYSHIMPYINFICETIKMLGSRTVTLSSTFYSSLI